MPNPYFDALGNQEQPLYEDLMRESIYNHGILAYFIPRNHFETDEILGKSDSNFEKYYAIDVVIKDSLNFDADADLFEKFGAFVEKRITVVTHKTEFLNITKMEPRRGDLIRLPTWNMTLEIQAPDTMNVMEFGLVNIYELKCHMFESKGEEFETGNAEIDNLSNLYGTNLLNSDDADALEDKFNELVEFNKNNPFSNTF